MRRERRKKNEQDQTEKRNKFSIEDLLRCGFSACYFLKQSQFSFKIKQIVLIYECYDLVTNSPSSEKSYSIISQVEQFEIIFRNYGNSISTSHLCTSLCLTNIFPFNSFEIGTKSDLFWKTFFFSIVLQMTSPPPPQKKTQTVSSSSSSQFCHHHPAYLNVLLYIFIYILVFTAC